MLTFEIFTLALVQQLNLKLFVLCLLPDHRNEKQVQNEYKKIRLKDK